MSVSQVSALRQGDVSWEVDFGSQCKPGLLHLICTGPSSVQGKDHRRHEPWPHVTTHLTGNRDWWNSYQLTMKKTEGRKHELVGRPWVHWENDAWTQPWRRSRGLPGSKGVNQVEETGRSKGRQRGLLGLLRGMQKKGGKQSTRSKGTQNRSRRVQSILRNTQTAFGLRAHSCISVPTAMSGTWQEPKKHWPRSHPRHQKPTWKAFENPQRIRGLRDRLRSTSPHSLVEYQEKKEPTCPEEPKTTFHYVRTSWEASRCTNKNTPPISFRRRKKEVCYVKFWRNFYLLLPVRGTSNMNTRKVSVTERQGRDSTLQPVPQQRAEYHLVIAGLKSTFLFSDRDRSILRWQNVKTKSKCFFSRSKWNPAHWVSSEQHYAT